MGSKVLWKYVLCCLNNKNCCLNNTNKEAHNNLSLSYSVLLKIAVHCSLKLKTKNNFLMWGVKKIVF